MIPHEPRSRPGRHAACGADPGSDADPGPDPEGIASVGPGGRRGFLSLAAGLPLGAASWRLWASPAGAAARPRTLVLFLRGACDGLSALVPYAEPFYRAARPTIALPEPPSPLVEPVAEQQVEASMRLDGRWALAPALAPSLGTFWEAGQLAAVPFAGTGFVSRSHFEAQDWIEFGQPSDAGRPDSRSGFLNRLLSQLSGEDSAPALGIAFTQGLPVSLRGQRPVISAALGSGSRLRAQNPPAMRAAAAHDERLLAMYAGHRLEPLVREGLALRRELEAGLARDMADASRQAISAGGFALEASRVGRLMRERPDYALGFIDVGGWDTHAAQAAYLAGRLRALGDGLLALADALGPAEWRRTLVVVLSEFGRTFRENGARGTDHGHGTVLWVLGGAVRGGRIVGEQASIAPGALHQDRDLPVLNEYRAVLGGLFARVYGLDAAALQAVFPRSRPLDLGLA